MSDPNERTRRPDAAAPEGDSDLEREIARRRIAEGSLQFSESWKASVLEAALEGIITVDRHGHIVDFNPAAEAMFGFRATEAIGRPMAQLIIPPSFRVQHQAAFDRYLKTGESRILGNRVELVGLKADGSEFAIELTVTALGRSSEPLFTAFIRDISDEKRSREALEAQLRATAFGRDLGLAITAVSGLDEMLDRCVNQIVAHLDVAFARIWTLDPGSEVLVLRASAGLYTHLDGDHARIALGAFKIGRIASTQTPHHTNNVIGDPQVHDQEWAREQRMVGFAGLPLVVEGRTTGVLAVFARSRITSTLLGTLGSVANAIAVGAERHRVEAELRHQSEALRIADRRKDELLAMLSHELRNPLAPLQNGLDALALETGGSSLLDDMRSQLGVLVRLVNDLLEVSRLTRRKIELRRSAIDLTDVVGRAVAGVEDQLEERGHALELSIPDDPVWIHADEVRIAQIVTNLLSNAIKYTPAGGHIAVTVEISTVASTTGSTGPCARVSVRDDGVGIDPESIERIFEPFEQIEQAIDRSEGGLGVGLTLVRDLVELHGGRVAASSAGEGTGAEIVVELPLGEAPTPVPDRKRRPAVTAGSGSRRVLIIDDNMSAADGLQNLLELAWGDEVRVAYDGLEGVALARAWNPHLVLVDLGLPLLDGFGVAKELRAAADIDPKPVIVAITGYGRDEDRDRSREAGFDAHLVKPVDLSDLDPIRAGLSDTE